MQYLIQKINRYIISLQFTIITNTIQNNILTIVAILDQLTQHMYMQQNIADCNQKQYSTIQFKCKK